VVSTRGAHPSTTATAKVRQVVTPKPKVTPKPVKHKAVAAAPKDEAVIRLTAVSDCWIGLNSATGQSLYQGTISAGQTMTWHEKHLVSMVIGNPSGVQLTVNGKPEEMNTVQVVTLSINPLNKTPVTVG
jgi:hypothetical protein